MLITCTILLFTFIATLFKISTFVVLFTVSSPSVATSPDNSFPFVCNIKYKFSISSVGYEFATASFINRSTSPLSADNDSNDFAPFIAVKIF